jgi:hypothetical protein
MISVTAPSVFMAASHKIRRAGVRGGQLGSENADPGRVAAGPRHASCEPTANHVIGHADDGNRLGRAMRSSDGRVPEGDDDHVEVRALKKGRCASRFDASYAVRIAPATASERIAEALIDVPVQPLVVVNALNCLLCRRPYQPRFLLIRP